MKKIIITLSAVFCMLGFTACGNSTESGSAAAGTSAQTEVVTQQTQAKKSDEPAKTEQSDEEKAAPEQTEEQPQTEDTDKGGKDTIVVYFSATGTTKDVAEKIAKIEDADLYEIVPAEPYSDADLNWNDSGSRSTKEQNDSSSRPAIGSAAVSLEGYKKVYIGYPIWWGEEPRILDTFVESYNFDGITMIPFCTSGGSGLGRSGKNLEERAGSGNWLDGKRFGAGPSEDTLRSWIEDLK